MGGNWSKSLNDIKYIIAELISDYSPSGVTETEPGVDDAGDSFPIVNLYFLYIWQ